MRTLDPALIRHLLEDLAARASAAGISAGVRVVGGAAVSFHDPHRRLTADVDALILPGGALDPITSQLAREYDLPSDWINSGGTKSNPSNTARACETFIKASEARGLAASWIFAWPRVAPTSRTT